MASRRPPISAAVEDMQWDRWNERVMFAVDTIKADTDEVNVVEPSVYICLDASKLL